MPKFLLSVNYGLEGVRALSAQGGTARRTAADVAATSVGGSIESFHFAFGRTDAYVIVDVPDNEAAAALALAVSSGGGATVTTTVLLTPEEIDAATRQQVSYRPPGE